MENHSDELIFQSDICAETSQISLDATIEIAFANFYCAIPALRFGMEARVKERRENFQKKVCQWVLLFTGIVIFLLGVAGGIWYFVILQNKENPEKRQTVMEENPLLFPENPEEENLADMLQTAAGGAMVQITAGGLRGSGVIYNASEEFLVIATAAHVLEQTKENIQIEFCNGFLAETSLWQTVPDADLAFLQLALSDIPAEYLQEYYVVSTDRDSFDRLQPGDGVIVLGSERDVAGNAYEGVIVENWVFLEDFSQYMMLARGEALQGMSGGGVFDQRGHFIGILCGGNADGELAVLPLSIIEARYLERF